jgi:hypothetical protein
LVRVNLVPPPSSSDGSSFQLLIANVDFDVMLMVYFEMLLHQPDDENGAILAALCQQPIGK